MERKDFFKNYNLNRKLRLNEGVLYNKYSNSFIFNFNEDDPNDVIRLENANIKSQPLNGRVYLYGYELEEKGIHSNWFVNWLKDQFNNGTYTEEIKNFIGNAINWLNRDFNLVKNFKCIIYPDATSNKLVQYIMDNIYNYVTNSSETVTRYSIVKNLPQNITFNWERFKDNNPDLYTPLDNKYEEQYRLLELEMTERRINQLMDAIHNKDEFKLHECGFDVEERKYLENFLTIDSSQDYTVLENLKNTDAVLLVDDTRTSGTTINEMIRAISVINSNCNIIIFTLIKGQDGDF